MKSFVSKNTSLRVMRTAGHRLGVALGAVVLTLVFFIVLPVMQTITKPLTHDLIVMNVDLGQVDPPPPAPLEQEAEEEPETEEAPPQMVEAEAAPLDLGQLDMLLSPGGGGSGFSGMDVAVRLGAVTSAGDGGGFSSIVSLADLDQPPRPTRTPSPKISSQLRGKGPARVIVIFIVNEQGHVESPRVWKSDNPLFDGAALDAIKNWRFEPGMKGGKAVRFRNKLPFAFPK